MDQVMIIIVDNDNINHADNCIIITIIEIIIIILLVT